MLFKTDKKTKYTVVDNTDELETVDLEPMKRRICSPAFLWTSLFTGVLIGTYYIPSIGLTFYQKWLYKNFHFPFITVLVHMSVKFILAALIRICYLKRPIKPTNVQDWKGYVMAVAPSGVFGGIDIGLSNWGLELVIVTLYTMTKSTSIIFILIFSVIFKLEKKSWSLCGIVMMITLGLILLTYKSTQFNLFGFILILVASISSGIRWTCVQLLLQKSKMGMTNPVDMIYHMQPWMIVVILPLAIFIEGPTALTKFQQLWECDDHKLFRITMKILLGAFIAFFMEFSEVLVVTYTSGLTLSIAGILKEVVQVVISVVWKKDQLSTLNVVGLICCLFGISFHVFHKIKNQPARPQVRLQEFGDEGNEYLISTPIHESSSESDEEKSDRVLFDIINRRER